MIPAGDGRPVAGGRDGISRTIVGDIFRDTFLGFVRAHLLYHAAKAPIYGVEMIRELREHGYGVSPGTLYPILHAMEGAGLLVSVKRIVAGKTRKYYAATPAGLAALRELQDKIRELTTELLERPPKGRRARR